MGAGAGKSTEGSQVTVNFNFQFAPPPAVVVANLHSLLRSVKGETWTQLHNLDTGNFGEGGLPLSAGPSRGIWVRPPNTVSHHQPGAATAKQTVIFTAEMLAGLCSLSSFGLGFG